MLAGVLKQITGQMANMTQNQSYLGAGHNVKEAYDAYVPTSYQSKFYLEKLPVRGTCCRETTQKIVKRLK
jgi:hypothetical protein